MNPNENQEVDFDAEVEEFLAVPRTVDGRAGRITQRLPRRFSEVTGKEKKQRKTRVRPRKRKSFPVGLLLAACAPIAIAALGYFLIREFLQPPDDSDVPVIAVDPISTEQLPTPEPAPEIIEMVKIEVPEPKPLAPEPKMAVTPDPVVVEEEPKAEKPLPWSFEPVLATAPPEVTNSAWPLSDIDQFILAKHESAGLNPVGDARLEVLLRRVTYDLIGLPPSASEAERFLKDAKDQGRLAAFEAVVDDLMSRQQFGEKWARHWLDLAGYDAGVENAWRFREYVIAAFNDDKPFNQFVAEQIAGDLLPINDPARRLEARIATGFLAMGPASPDEPDIEQFHMDQVDRQIDLTTRTFLGLSVACARCHNHKFDPISKYDYYALAGIFRSTQTLTGFKHDDEPEKVAMFLPMKIEDAVRVPLDMLETQEREENLKRLETLVRGTESRMLRAEGNGDSDRAERLKTTLAAVSQKRNQVANLDPNAIRFTQYEAIGLWEAEAPGNARLNIRGNVHKLGDPVERGFPEKIQVDRGPNQIPEDVSGRLELAKWLLAEDQPLTSRVFVNRIWAQLLGEGLVRTVDEFGVQGEEPTHPELLDFLARDFIVNDWSMKRLVRQIVLSRVYQLDAAPTPANLAADPDNRLFWRRNLRQLTGEELRDSLVYAAGVLTEESAAAQKVKRFFARGEYGALSTFVDATEFPLSSSFRTIYLPIVDSNPGMLASFDCPEPGTRAPERASTTSATQAMFMMNNEFVYQAASAAASPIAEQKTRTSDYEKLRRMFLTVLGRRPTKVEETWALEFLNSFESGRDVSRAALADIDEQKMGDDAGADDEPNEEEAETAAPWTMLFHALFETAEFRFLR
ncbi:MAG: hypothetical protein ACI8UO_003582 [Verrucomicrobiales bacterium]|jgi:hypothetical protein